MDALPVRLRERHLPGEAGIWVLILGDLVIFTAFFATYLYYRGQSPAPYAQAQSHLHPAIGAANTLLMLSSSWFVASAVKAARRDAKNLCAAFFLSALACGLAFVAAKYIEYGIEIRAGYILTTNEFFGFYYVFTGVHLLHVLLGMAVLAGLARYSRSGGFDQRKIRNLESGASFWHLVDLLWIVLFPLLYLLK